MAVMPLEIRGAAQSCRDRSLTDDHNVFALNHHRAQRQRLRGQAAWQVAARSHDGPRDVASGFAASDFDGPVFGGAGDAGGVFVQPHALKVVLSSMHDPKSSD